MRLKKFEELPYFLENYKVDLINSDVISIAKEKSIVHRTQRGHKICRLLERLGTGDLW